MSWFKRKMKEKAIKEEHLEEDFKVEDKRRFNTDGDRVNVDIKTEPSEPVKSAEVIALENALKDERTRREAAEMKLVEVQKRFDEAKNNLEKETAEMRERMRKTLEERAKQGQSNFITTLLPVLDNLNLAINAAQKDFSLENLIGGVKGTARSFEQALMSVGVAAVPSVGETFNPEMHEAIDMVATAPENDGKITAEYSRGYKFGERLLRPARVQVGRAS
jgi:molecular chaperone GrpE